MFSEDVSGFSIAPTGGLSPIAGSPFPDEIAPLGAAMTPDGRYLYVTNLESGDVSAFSVALDGALTPVAGSPFPAGLGPWGVAVTPDGQHLYVANDDSDSVSAYSIASDGSLTQLVGSPFSTGTAPGGMLPNGVAVSPDGNHLYVTNQGGGAHSVTAFSIASDGGLSPVPGSPFPTGDTPRGASFSPDGKYLYVANESSGSISVFSVSIDGGLSPITGSPFPTEGAPLDVAVSPDGRHLYVSHVGGDNKVWGYSILPDGGLSAVTGAPFPTGGQRSNSVAVTPDSRHLYVTNNTSKNVSAFSIASNGSLSTVAGSPFSAGAGPLQLVVSPDQGPVAAFSSTTSPAGDPSSFDALASTDGDGSVATYSWDFGDGTTEVTSSAIAAHVYAMPGEYTVTLTVIDDAGCSTAQTFTGQTVSCNGSPLAQLSQQAIVPPGIPLGISLAGSGSGSVASTPAGIHCPERCSYAYEPGADVTITAAPAPGSSFAGWSGGGCTGTGPCTVKVNVGTVVTATFNKLLVSPPPVSGPACAHLRIGHAQARPARSKARIVIAGTIAKEASGFVSINVHTYADGRRVTAIKRVRIVAGHWHGRLALPTHTRPLLYATARFAGSPGVQPGQAKRRLKFHTKN